MVPKVFFKAKGKTELFPEKKRNTAYVKENFFLFETEYPNNEKSSLIKMKENYTGIHEIIKLALIFVNFSANKTQMQL